MLKVKLVNPTEAAKLLGQHHGLYIQLRASRHCVHAGRRPGAVTATEAEGARGRSGQAWLSPAVTTSRTVSPHWHPPEADRPDQTR